MRDNNFIHLANAVRSVVRFGLYAMRGEFNCLAKSSLIFYTRNSGAEMVSSLNGMSFASENITTNCLRLS